MADPAWRAYEEDVATFFRSLGLDAKVEHVVEGVRSKHAIDVYVTFEKWGITHIWIVECKLHARPVTKADIETLKSIAHEVGASLAFILSESGFQAGALEAAQQTNVVPTSLEELKSKTKDELLWHEVAILNDKALELQERLHGMWEEIERESRFSRASRLRRGVDGDSFWMMSGSVAMLRRALDRVRLGKLPIVLFGDLAESPDAKVICRTLDEVVVEARIVLDRVEAWEQEQPHGPSPA